MKKRFFLMIIIAAVLILSGAGCAPKLTAEQVIENMTQTMVDEVDTFRFVSTVNIEGETPFLSTFGSESAETEIRMDLNGIYDNTESADPKLESTLNGAVFSEGVLIEAAGDLKMLRDMLYFRVRQMPAFIPIGIETGKWFYKDISEFKKESRLSEEETERLKRLFKKHRIIKATNDLGFEKINKVKCYHYEIALDREAATAYMYDLAKERQVNVTEKMKSDLDAMLDQLQQASGEIWIGKKDFFVRKIILNMPLEVDGGEMRVLLDMSINEYNEEIEILKPEGAEEFSQKIFN